VGLRSGDIGLYDVVAGERMNAVPTGHEATISQLGVVRSGGRPLLVSACRRNAIRVGHLAVHASG
jgi:hypothetical protein